MPKYKPLGNRVLIQIIPPTLSEGGVIITEATTSVKKLQKHVVIAVGPGLLLESGERVPIDLEPGDVIEGRLQVHVVDDERNLGLVDAETIWGVRDETAEYRPDELAEARPIRELVAEQQEAAAVRARLAQPPVPPSGRVRRMAPNGRAQ